MKTLTDSTAQKREQEAGVSRQIRRDLGKQFKTTHSLKRSVHCRM